MILHASRLLEAVLLDDLDVDGLVVHVYLRVLTRLGAPRMHRVSGREVGSRLHPHWHKRRAEVGRDDIRHLNNLLLLRAHVIRLRYLFVLVELA